ncbi:DNA primase [Stanieria cyanosphaera PCC 7437]|uniref:DNA primase n=1 Tax=Stanieria cyanosphaera (strain ATCC 29371 / PCC 7437) TaxID=111780 RepID=K9XYR7_STAC7|nr:DNA primase [Stanieria cyanosphaera]AFZ37271.1 DNA primase [Stanieria cyanosphaera PCC 7437]
MKRKDDLVAVPRLHQDTIDEVQQRVDIVDIVSEYVVLHKRGKGYLGLCPFHNEKTPSFSVSPDKQLYYCFGCAAGGNVFKFLMEIGKQSFSEVVFDLAKRYQVPIKTLEPEQRQAIAHQISVKEQLYEIVATAANFYQHALYETQGQVALEYLTDTRKFSESTLTQFQLGYAPAGWETLYRYLVEQKRYPVNLVEQAGLIKPRSSGNGYYDVFRDRAIIPILDAQGRIIAFGGRTLKDDQPKYLNSPETPLFDKSKTLFALDKARSSITKEDRAVVVEGYLDAIALHAVGITNVVASLGTALTSYQLKQLLRYTPSKQVILNFDADQAGTQATQRAIAEIEDLVYAGVVSLRILNLPEGKDADEFLHTNQNAVEIYRKSLNDAPLWLDWQIQQLLLTQNIHTPSGLQKIAQGMIKLLNQIQDANLRNYYLSYCAELLSQGDGRLIPQNLANLRSQLTKTSLKPYFKKQQSNQSNSLNLATNPEQELLERAESLLLKIYLHCPRYRAEIIDRLEEQDFVFRLPHHRFLWQQIIQVENKEQQNLPTEDNYLLTELQNLSLTFTDQMQSVTKLFYLDQNGQEDIFRAATRIDNATATLEQVACVKQQIEYTQELNKLNPTTDLDSIETYYQKIQSLKKRIQELEQIRLASV